MLYENDGIYTVGLTGMSGAGKSTACRVFAENGFCVIDCDLTAKEVVMKGRPALIEITEHFSRDVIKTNGALDRPKLAGIVFSDNDKLRELNGIIYPYIIYAIIEKTVLSGEKLILFDAPTLFESGADRLCDATVCVTADRELCISRIMLRDGLTRSQAEMRLSSQHDASFYTGRCDHSAVNNGSPEELRAALESIADRIKRSVSEVRD
ncbi:MAG: dephospho-CoA kinase [Ruminiclostridium sp.]|nr:dephospho-CoA kinase [Ruminiclostridium sp.]